MGNNTYSAVEMMEALQLKDRRYFTKEYLKPAIEQGLIEPVYPKQPKNAAWKIRVKIR